MSIIGCLVGIVTEKEDSKQPPNAEKRISTNKTIGISSQHKISMQVGDFFSALSHNTIERKSVKHKLDFMSQFLTLITSSTLEQPRNHLAE